MKLVIKFTSLLLLLVLSNKNLAQSSSIHHAEPLYFDLVRGPGASKGEKEFNIAADFARLKNYNRYLMLAEYEFVPIDRLGLEVETDFLLIRNAKDSAIQPESKLEGIRLSAQYAFLILPEHQTTLAVGYTQVVEFSDFKSYGKNPIVTGMLYNPFFVAAKIWGSNLHTILYFSPFLEHSFRESLLIANLQINASILYSVPKTNLVAGIEVNQEIIEEKFGLTIRPQVKAKLNRKLSLGIVAGIPVTSKQAKYSTFLRLIYEL